MSCSVSKQSVVRRVVWSRSVRPTSVPALHVRNPCTFLFLKRQRFRLDSIEEAEPSEHEGHFGEICVNPASLINCSNLILAKIIR